jgi:hypothetical protein
MTTIDTESLLCCGNPEAFVNGAADLPTKCSVSSRWKMAGSMLAVAMVTTIFSG